MDYNCRDIPMRLDTKYQPLNFDIYLSQVIDLPRTSLDEPPYDFKLELEALELVDKILERSKTLEQQQQNNTPTDEQQAYSIQDLLETQLPELSSKRNLDTATKGNEKCNSHNQTNEPSSTDSTPKFSHTVSTPLDDAPISPKPSCPIETPLTPIKCSAEPYTSSASNPGNSNQQPNERAPLNKINLTEFEEINYNPFDHIELQTIDELRELDLVFQASYANQAKNNN